jgi:hypothetical protein
VGRSYVQHVVELVQQVAEAAHALHEAGVVHRDIKPGNIMVSADGGQAVLMDLGLAQLADEAEGRLTRTRQFVGTLRYASPQQVLAVAQLDRRSDVYSLGATLWELLTLRPLYGATEQTPTPELMERIQRQEPERPRRHNPGIARDLEAVVLKCLEKDPARRYLTAQELAEDLRRFLEGEPVVARPVSGAERGLRWAVRHPTAAGLLAASGLALLALVGLAVAGYYTTWLNDAKAQLEKALGSAEEQRQQAVNAKGEAERAKGEAEAARQGEETQRKRAEAQRERADGLLYFMSIERAHSAWRENDVQRAADILARCDPTLRNWEWSYLYRLCHSDLRTFKGHTSAVHGVAWSPDGTRLGSASADGTVRVWDAGTGQEAVTLTRDSDVNLYQVRGVAFSPDGTRLAGARDDGTVRVWDVRTGQQVLTLKGHTKGVHGVTFSPDGTRLASASDDQTVKVWDAKKGQEALTLKGHTREVRAVAFSPDGTRLASASGDFTVRVWDTLSARERRQGQKR